ncbi:hypothetical protein E6H36_10405 [Candidatus Bathyarchaeota archaeon]|nr:MAG: hypothetical protein E6H36_10405 [Candidatus Bathyarchaeota archaeon]
MRRLLIKMVAVETALVGWLSYWLFLVYADNPSVTQALADKLSKFPQFSFTTIDISVLVVIGVLALLLALKFQRGLRPGIRLERALEMLETLMKRNLYLESQVAELKVTKGHVTQPVTSPVPSAPEPQLGSWERAFRTPIEAGSGAAIAPTRPSLPASVGPVHDRAPFSPSSPAFRVDTKPMASPSPARPPILSNDRQDAKPVERKVDPDVEKTVTLGTGVTPSNWEDSPKRVVETSGVLNALREARKRVPIIPDSTVNTPVPVLPFPTKVSPPQGVIVGPGASPLSQRRPSLRPTPALLPPKAGPSGLLGPASPASGPTPTTAGSLLQKNVEIEARPSGEKSSTSEASEPETDSDKPAARPRPQVKKRFPFEEE